MNHHILEMLRAALVHYGYWAVAVALLLENAGLPVPGETILLLASFLAFSEQDLRLGWIILIGSLAAPVGDDLGCLAGQYGGRALIERYRQSFLIGNRVIERGEKLFERYGSAAILF